MNLDDELRLALQRKNPPAGFDRRILTRIASGDTVSNPASRPRWRRFVLPIAASLLFTFSGTYYVQQREQWVARQQWAAAERATRDVTLALHIASEKLAAVQTKVQEMNHHERPIQP